MIEFIKWLISLATPENLAKLATLGGPWWVSYAIVTAMVFSETGLLIGFFLPGDSLLFACGVMTTHFINKLGQPVEPLFNFWALGTCLMCASMLGNTVNYMLGRQMGIHVFEKGRLRFVKHEHLLAAKAFYEKHGVISIVLAQFVPIVRTFTPFVAGVARMRYRTFAFFNVMGAIVWVWSLTTAGHFLGQIRFIQEHIEVAILTIIFVSVIPVFVGFLRHRAERRAAKLNVQNVEMPA